MEIKEIREALLELRDKTYSDVLNEASIGIVAFQKITLDTDRLRALAAIDILDKYLWEQQIQEDMDAQGYTDEELFASGRCNNMMAILIESHQIKLTPTLNGRGSGCLAYRPEPDQNACQVCAYWKTCFGTLDDLSLANREAAAGNVGNSMG